MTIADSNLHWARPARGNGTGVLVVAGSSGRLDAGRAEMLASRGVTALALRWFGGSGQPAVPREIPLETFTEAIRLLAGECERVVLIGLSYGAEAALLTASTDDRVDAMVALAPTDVAWEGQHENDDDPRRSKWTLQGRPVSFVPLDRAWEPPSTPPAFVDCYEHSRELAGADAVEAATIPSEKIQGEVVLVAGGDDQVWPSFPSRQEHRGSPGSVRPGDGRHRGPDGRPSRRAAGRGATRPGQAVPGRRRRRCTAAARRARLAGHRAGPASRRLTA